MRNMAWLAWLCVALVSETAAGQDVGKHVIAIRDTEIMVGETVLRKVACGQVFNVREIKGERLLVSDNFFPGRPWINEDDDAGWIDKKHVATFDNAFKLFDERIEQSPLEPRVYLARGLALRCLSINGDIADFDEAIRLDPTFAEAFRNRGVAWQKEEKFDKAIADFDEAIRLDPKLAEAFRNRGAAWQELEKFDKAIEDFSEAIRLDPTLAEAFYNRAEALEQEERYDKATADYDALILLNPKDATALSKRALCLSVTNEYVKATADYDALIRLKPKDASAFNHRAFTWTMRGEPEKAIADYDEAIWLNPKLTHAFYFRGQLFRDKGRYEKAIADFDEAIRLNPKDAFALKERAWLQATCPEDRFRDGRKAVEQAAKACELTEWKNADFIETLAAAHAEAGDFEMAVKWQTQACEFAQEFEKGDSRAKIELYRSGKPYRDKLKN